MSTNEILMYSIGSVFSLSALAFTYYAFKNPIFARFIYPLCIETTSYYLLTNGGRK